MSTSIWIATLAAAVVVTWMVAFKTGHWNRDRQLRQVEEANAKTKAMKFGGMFDYPPKQPVVPALRSHRSDCGTPEAQHERTGIESYAQEILMDDWMARVRGDEWSFDQLMREADKLKINKHDAAAFITKTRNRVSA